MSRFLAFPEPKTGDDKPLVRHAGKMYLCNGCDGEIPDGAWLYEQIVEGMVVGLLARAGAGADAVVVHACGTAAQIGG